MLTQLHLTHPLATVPSCKASQCLLLCHAGEVSHTVPPQATGLHVYYTRVLICVDRHRR